MNDNRDKRLFTLDVISSIDDDVIEKNLKKRFLLWHKKKRLSTRFISSIIAVAACFFLIVGSLFWLIPALSSDKQVPIYRGMTVSNAASNEVLAASAPDTFSLPVVKALSASAKLPCQLLIDAVNGGNRVLAPDGNTPEIVFGESYYAMKNEDIFIYIHLSNPDNFEILSFTLNGKKYSSNMFEYGSDLETIIIKYNVGNVNGMQSYTIDAIKYVDGEAIKDVRMEGDKTVRVFVNDDTSPLHFESTQDGFDVVIEPIWATGFTGDKTILSLALYDGEEKLRDLDVTTTRLTDLPEGKRLILQAVYLENGEQKTVRHIFDTRAQSTGLAIKDGVVTGIGSCTDEILYINMPIAAGAFKTDKQIKELYTGAGCTYIERDAFKSSSITKAILSEGLTSIGRDAFYNCLTLQELVLPNSLNEYFWQAISHCVKLKTVVLPDHITSIPNGAFASRYSLTNIVIPDSVTKIGAYAFQSCGLVNIVIPDSITSIGREAFRGCGALTAITLPSGITQIEAHTFSGCSSLKEIVIPDGVVSIGEGAFAECTSLVTITNPNSVTSLGEAVFDHCQKLETITLSENLTVIPESAFHACQSIQEITLPESLESIGQTAFSGCTKLKTILIPDGVTTIGQEAFLFCSSLESITIPSSIVSIGNGAFSECTSLSYTEYQNGNYLGNAENPHLVLMNALSTELSSFEIASTTKIIYARAFYGCAALTNITLPDGVTHLGVEVFSGCTSLVSVTLPDGVTTISERAFYGCTSLACITLPSSIVTIEDLAFCECVNLTGVIIPDSVIDMGAKAFDACYNTIYCRAEQKPSTWMEDWATSAEIVWGYESN